MTIPRRFEELPDYEKVFAILAATRKPLTKDEVLKAAGVTSVTTKVEQLLSGSRLPTYTADDVKTEHYKIEVKPQLWVVMNINEQSVHMQMANVLAEQLGIVKEGQKFLEFETGQGK